MLKKRLKGSRSVEMYGYRTPSARQDRVKMFFMKTVDWLGLGLLLSSSLASARNGKMLSFSGTWIRNMQRRRVEAAHSPVLCEAVIL
jgi:hypothetical protein